MGDETNNLPMRRIAKVDLYRESTGSCIRDVELHDKIIGVDSDAMCDIANRYVEAWMGADWEVVSFNFVQLRGH